ncbi:hypothetical protein ACFQ1Q_13690 [Winogradskyella litorisediminis]|uniref:Uncharacterized protein n=1 Tax=Winogradskyella litorisediminis TaxID=1156618 RepID=A0ABW3NAE1_9FLAO
MTQYRDEIKTRELIEKIEPYYQSLSNQDRLKLDVIKQTIESTALDHSGYDDILETLEDIEVNLVSHRISVQTSKPFSRYNKRYLFL